MNQDIIDKVAAAGFDVWMRDPKDTWMIFTDGKNLGYLQFDRMAGYTISTVHMPNKTSGTGFQIERHVSDFDRATLARAFIHCPDWFRRDAESVLKYRGIEDYRAANNFNAAYQLVAKGASQP
jgi:hypothetical protein